MLLSFTAALIAFIIFFISKRNGMKDKIFGLVALYLYLNFLLYFIWKETQISGLLYFASAVDSVFLIFTLFILKYVSEGENK